MLDGEFKYVRHNDVPTYEERGWKATSALEGTHHGEYSVLMVKDDKPPVIPQIVEVCPGVVELVISATHASQRYLLSPAALQNLMASGLKVLTDISARQG